MKLSPIRSKPSAILQLRRGEVPLKRAPTVAGGAVIVKMLGRLLIKLAALALGSSLFCLSEATAYAEPAIIEGKVSCFAIYKNNLCDLIIELTGEITATSTERIQSILDASKTRTNWLLKQVVIDSPGGNVDASMAIGKLLRENRFSITVPKGGQCASACVLIFAGAVRRTAFGKIGIHRPYFNRGVNSVPVSPEKVQGGYAEMLNGMRAFLRAMNVSEGLADDMLKVAPAEIRYLNQEDLNNYGLSFVDPVEQETIDLEDARKLGLDRGEYVRRQAIQKTKCGTLPFSDLLTCEERVMKFGR
jgi:hypothetical protein